MTNILPSRFYGDPANVIDELREMQKREAKRTNDRRDFKAKLENDLEGWREKNVRKNINLW